MRFPGDHPVSLFAPPTPSVKRTHASEAAVHRRSNLHMGASQHPRYHHKWQGCVRHDPMRCQKEIKIICTNTPGLRHGISVGMRSCMTLCATTTADCGVPEGGRCGRGGKQTLWGRECDAPAPETPRRWPQLQLFLHQAARRRISMRKPRCTIIATPTRTGRVIAVLRQGGP